MATAEASRSVSFDIRNLVDRTAELVVPAGLFETLMTDKLGVALRGEQGRLEGKNHFVVFYAPLLEWAQAKQAEIIGDWVYGEWSDKIVTKALDGGGTVQGSRVVMAVGSAKRAGNGTVVSISRLAVGLVEEDVGVMGAVHFLGAVNMAGLREVTSTCPEHEFYSCVTGFIATRGDKAVPAFYPLKGRGRS
jgi:hypothetical protein